MYAVSGLVEIAKLGLDKACTFSAVRMTDLLARALQSPIAQSRNRFLLHFYSAHYQWERGLTAPALASLDAAHKSDPSDPMPLFLSSEWLSHLGRRDDGLRAFARGRVVANQSGKDYAEIISTVNALYITPTTPKT